MHRSINTIVTVLAISLGGVIVCEIIYILVLVPLVKIKTIVLQTDLSVSQKELFQFLGLADPLLFFQVDEEVLTHSLTGHPEIISADVEKQFPDTLHITLYGRTPVAYVALDDAADANLLLLDDAGVIYSRIAALPSSSLPIVSFYNDYPMESDSAEQQLQMLAALLKNLQENYLNSYTHISEIVLLPDQLMYIYTMSQFVPIRLSATIAVSTLHTVISQTPYLYNTVDANAFFEVDVHGEHAVLRRRRL